MNPNYVARSLCFHGQPMQKIWDDERGIDDLHKMRLAQPNYDIYMERQKHFTFQDRAKRLKLHQFFARKALDLYDKNLEGSVMEADVLEQTKSYVAMLPPYENFLNIKDKSKCWQYMLSGIKPGDIIYASVVKVLTASTTRLCIKPLCTAEPLVRLLSDVPIKAFIYHDYIGTLPLDKNGKPRNYNPNDYICCEVFEISVDAERLTLGMTGILTESKLKLGLVDLQDFPAYYRKTLESNSERYVDYLKQSKEFENPNYEILFTMNGLNMSDTFTLMPAIKYGFPRTDYARELRQAQASKWAFRSVAEGIERFKNGQHIEAFQCLNKALNIDPRNVEGLVARGALYANKGSFLKAIDDFEKALNLNSYHVNARKYMGETLVALGRSYEEEQRLLEASKAYRDCLNIIPDHEQARLSLETMQQRRNMQIYDVTHNLLRTQSTAEPLMTKALSQSSVDGDSSSDSDSNSDDSSDTSGKRREASLSPLSRRMILHDAAMRSSGSQQHQTQQFNQPYYALNKDNNVTVGPPKKRDRFNEFKLEEDDTANRVIKLIEQASKHKVIKKKSKKKKSKKPKKSNKVMDPTELLKKIDFEQAYKIMGGTHLESKLNKNLEIYEKTISQLKKRQENQTQYITTSFNTSNSRRQAFESPPHQNPTINLKNYFDNDYEVNDNLPSTSNRAMKQQKRQRQQLHSEERAPPSPPKLTGPQQKFSFQIRKPVKVDKFGLVRIATPLATNKSQTRSPSPKGPKALASTRREYSPSPSCSRSPDTTRPNRDRNSLISRDIRKGSYSRDNFRSFSKERSYSSRGKSRERYARRRATYSRSRDDTGKRRTPSPFVPRGTPSPRSRNRRSRSRDFPQRRRNHSDRSRSPRGKFNKQFQKRQQFGNRTWKRPDLSTTAQSNDAKSSNAKDGQWLHDKYTDDDGPTIEEVDAIINQAQKERKQEIINRDKDILKKTSDGSF